MLLSGQPTLIPLAFATGGDKNAIPENTNATPGGASLNLGFPPLTRTPIASGGIPPFGQDMNGIMFMISALSRWQSAGGSITYNSAFATDTNVGGYPQGAVLLRADGTGFWFNTTDNNATNPDTGGAGWVPAFNYGITSVALTSSNVTLTALQAAKNIIVLTGTMTTNLNLIFPTTTQAWLVINNTTGGFTVTCKTAGGTGVVSQSGFNQQVYGDGTNIKSALPAASGVIGASTGLTMNVPTASATATVVADQVVVGTALGGPVSILPNFSQSINLATTGAGGMDTGSAPTSGYVAIYAAFGPGGTCVFAQDTTSAVAPTVYGGANLPAGYTQTALLTVYPTDGSGHLVPGYASGKDVSIILTAVVSTSSPPTFPVTADLSPLVPKNAKSFTGAINVTTSGTGAILAILAPTNSASITIGRYIAESTLASAGNTVWAFSKVPIFTSQTAYFGISTTATFSNLIIDISAYSI